MTTTFRQTFTFRDAQGHTSQMRMFMVSGNAADTGTLVTAVIAALQGVSNAHLESSRGADYVDAGFGYGSQAVFGSIEDKAQIAFTGFNHSLHRYNVPAPKALCFLADGDTLDTAATEVAALITAMTSASGTAFVSDGDGHALAGIAGGFRRRVKTQRRVNIYTLDPTETGPAE